MADDCSTDDTAEVIPRWLERSGLNYRYFRHPHNLGYDGNLRSALRAATGDYLYVLGNDDALPHPETLARIAALLEQNGRPAVAFGNYVEASTPDHPSTRARQTVNLGGGPDVALRMFRAFSCVTGLLYSREAYLAHDTDKYDGSVYVQMYLGSRIVASGGSLLAIDDTIAVTGLHVDGRHAKSYKDWLPKFRWRIKPELGGLDEVGRVVCAAIVPTLPPADHQQVVWEVFRQLLTYSYPYWLYDYRQNSAYWGSLNLAIGCFPTHLVRNVDVSAWTLARLLAVYAAATTAGLFIPLRILDPLKEVVRWTSRRI